MTTHYTTLGIAENASDEEIRQAHSRRLRECRNDTNRQRAEDRKKIINSAYNSLKNPEKRQAYDEKLARNRRNSSNTHSSTTGRNNTSQSRRSQQSSAPPPPPPPPPPPVNSSDETHWIYGVIGVLMIIGVVYFVINFLTEEKNSTSESQSVTTAEPLNADTVNLLGLVDDEDSSNQENQVTDNYCSRISLSEHWIKLGETCYQVELASNPDSQSRGLGFRQSMLAEYGMLYIYEHPKLESHGTVNMLFPIDILFFDNDRRLINQHHNALPCNNGCPSYSSNLPARYALELNAGQAAQLNLKIGDELIFGPSIPQSKASSLDSFQKKIEQFSIQEKILKENKRLVQLILYTESMDDEERQYWFDILPSMNDTHIARLLDILETERAKLEELDIKY